MGINNMGAGVKYNFHYDIAAMVLTIIILIHYYHKKSIKESQSHVFNMLLWLSFVTDIIDILTVIADEKRMSAGIVNTINVIYLIGFNTAPFLYYLYLLTMNKRKDLWSHRDKLILYAPLACVIVLVATSPWTHFIFYYNLTDGYCHGAGFPILYAATVIYMAGTVELTVIYRQQMTAWQRTAVYLYLLVSASGIVFQVIMPNVLLMQFVACLSLLMLYMSLENPDDDED